MSDGLLRPGDEELGSLAAEFPGWHPWKTGEGRYVATRRCFTRPPDGAPGGWAMRVEASCAEELRAEIEWQEELGRGNS